MSRYRWDTNELHAAASRICTAWNDADSVRGSHLVLQALEAAAALPDLLVSAVGLDHARARPLIGTVSDLVHQHLRISERVQALQFWENVQWSRVADLSADGYDPSWRTAWETSWRTAWETAGGGPHSEPTLEDVLAARFANGIDLVTLADSIALLYEGDGFAIIRLDDGRYLVLLTGIHAPSLDGLDGFGVNRQQDDRDLVGALADYNAANGLGGGSGYSAAVRAAIEALPGEPTLIFAGHSQGGLVAHHLASTMTDHRVDGVVTFGSPVSQSIRRPETETEYVSVVDPNDPVGVADGAEEFLVALHGGGPVAAGAMGAGAALQGDTPIDPLPSNLNPLNEHDIRHYASELHGDHAGSSVHEEAARILRGARGTGSDVQLHFADTL